MITYNRDAGIFKIDTENSSYIFGVVDNPGYLVSYYYGRRISSDNVRSLSVFDENVLPSKLPREKLAFLDCIPYECPCSGVGDFRPSPVEIKEESGTVAAEFFYDSHTIYKGTKNDTGMPMTFGTEDDSETLEVVMKDPVLNIKETLVYKVFPDLDVITRHIRLENMAKEKAVYITKALSFSLDMVNKDYELLTLPGSWSRERKKVLTRITEGYKEVSSERCISSAQENPFIAVTSNGVNEDFGEVYGFNLVYSGSFQAGVHLNQFNYMRILMGINSHNFSWKLEGEDTFTTPEAVLVYSHEGLGRMTRCFHDLYRRHLIRSPYKNKQRPILINNWEATYFDFNTEKLLSIARDASKAGIEMLVMDDGWFGNRFDDNRALGDWVVNEQKLPGGLNYLVSEVNKLGLKFGIWMEPEMVCEDSDLYRSHPDWAIAIKGRKPGAGRNQYVLDITRPEVLEHTWNSIKNIMDSANIEYVKWDMNRPVTDVGSLGLLKDRMGEFSFRYTLAVYELQNRLVTNYPNLLFENCSSGGGRFDPGMLYYSPQIWCSDDTDAIERLKIQEGTALVYPLSSMGAHISDCPNHILGRTVPFETRGHVALAGTFGYELDITRIPKEDRDIIPSQVKMYKKYNDLVREGDYYRLESYMDNNARDSWMVVSKDKSEALVTFVSVYAKSNVKPYILKLKGLDPLSVYACEETGEEYTGDLLMYAGLPINPMWGDYKSKLIHFNKR